ncbi:MAG TPA: hypothetical protein VND21_05355 [Planctomycetota bacterium]|nr:hypothetical protein [Planctomycetota bacterium]
MAKLQPCPKCGAQFDVSAFAQGAKFTCGACGAVVTAGAAVAAPAAPARVPPAPSRPVPAPAGGGRRGPQYQPPERHAATAAPAPATSSRGGSARHGRHHGERSETSSKHGAPPKSGMSPLVMTGIGAAVLAIAIGAFLSMKKDDKPTAGGGGTNVVGTDTNTTKPGPAVGGMGETAAPEPPKSDSLAGVEADWKNDATRSDAELKKFLERYKALGSAGAERSKEVAKEIVSISDPNYKLAREVLGHKEFAFEVPEVISFRKYPYIRVVEEAAKQHWFDDDEAFKLAMTAWEKTKAHAAKLDTDPVFRALDGARLEIARDKHFKDYNYEAIFASPYLICYSSTERMSEEELFALPPKERSKKLEELEKNREQYRQILAEKARIYQQLYAEFMRRYAEDCELKDLMSPFGGREDYPVSKRSYRDGCPLIIWIFSDRQAFDDYHSNVKNESIDPGVAGYFSPVTGWVYLYDEGSQREFEINKNVHEGTHQLEHWFTKQKKEWGAVRRPQSFFGEGFAEYMGAVTMAKDRKLTFHGVNRPRLEFLQSMRQQLKSGGKSLYVFPVKDLVSFEGYHRVREWAAQKWQIDGLGYFYAQSWAFVYFLNEHQSGKYKKNFTRFLDDMLVHPRENGEGYTFNQFKKAMNIRSEDDWKKLDKEFADFYSKLIDMDTKKIALPPPARDDWPDYEPIDPVNPLAASAPKNG